MRCVAAFLLTCMATLACAQTYPQRPIRVIVPYPAGSGTDLVARAFGQKLGEAIGQPLKPAIASGSTSIPTSTVSGEPCASQSAKRPTPQ